MQSSESIVRVMRQFDDSFWTGVSEKNPGKKMLVILTYDDASDLILPDITELKASPGGPKVKWPVSFNTEMLAFKRCLDDQDIFVLVLLPLSCKDTGLAIELQKLGYWATENFKKPSRQQLTKRQCEILGCESVWQPHKKRRRVEEPVVVVTPSTEPSTRILSLSTDVIDFTTGEVMQPTLRLIKNPARYDHVDHKTWFLAFEEIVMLFKQTHGSDIDDVYLLVSTTGEQMALIPVESIGHFNARNTVPFADPFIRRISLKEVQDMAQSRDKHARHEFIMRLYPGSVTCMF